MPHFMEIKFMDKTCDSSCGKLMANERETKENEGIIKLQN